MIIPKGSNPNHEHYQSKALRLIESLNPSYVWNVTAKRHRKKRSNPQNSYHWGVVVKMISDETGHDPTEMHEFLLGEHVGWVEYEFMDEIRRRPSRRSLDMDVQTFENFNEWCRAWASTNLGMVIPDPPDHGEDQS